MYFAFALVFLLFCFLTFTCISVQNRGFGPTSDPLNTTNDVNISATCATFAIATRVMLKLLLARTDKDSKDLVDEINRSGGPNQQCSSVESFSAHLYFFSQWL
jgi:hypothetical protein